MHMHYSAFNGIRDQEGGIYSYNPCYSYTYENCVNVAVSSYTCIVLIYVLVWLELHKFLNLDSVYKPLGVRTCGHVHIHTHVYMYTMYAYLWKVRTYMDKRPKYLSFHYL